MSKRPRSRPLPSRRPLLISVPVEAEPTTPNELLRGPSGLLHRVLYVTQMRNPHQRQAWTQLSTLREGFRGFYDNHSQEQADNNFEQALGALVLNSWVDTGGEGSDLIRLNEEGLSHTPIEA